MSIPIVYIRSSIASTFAMCPMKAFIEYTLGWRGQSGKKADKGTIVHKTLELLAVVTKKKKGFTDEETGIRVTPKIEVGKLSQEVYDYYTNLMSHHEWTDKDERECIRWVDKAITFNNGQFDPRNMKVIDAEPHFDFELDYDWAKYEYEYQGETLTGQLALKGTIDLITEVDDEVYEIIDWKTGRRLNWATGEVKDYKALRKDFQLRMYHLAAMNLYPNIENFIVTIYFMNDGGPFSLTFERSDIPETIDMIREQFENISKSDNPEVLYEINPRDSWKCRKFCSAGMTTFEDTDILPIVEKRYGEITQYDKCMSKCEQVKYCIEHRGVDKVINNMTAAGHKIHKYHAPGQVDTGSKKI